MSEWESPYTKSDDVQSVAWIYCMKCAKELCAPTYHEMVKKNAPKEKVLVYSRSKHSNYRQVGIAIEKDGMGSTTYIPICGDCVNFELTEEIKPKIEKLIRDAYQADAEWSGIIPAAPSGSIKVLRRL